VNRLRPQDGPQGNIDDCLLFTRAAKVGCLLFTFGVAGLVLPVSWNNVIPSTTHQSKAMHTEITRYSRIDDIYAKPRSYSLLCMWALFIHQNIVTSKKKKFKAGIQHSQESKPACMKLIKKNHMV
jgi:hypothetical protein